MQDDYDKPITLNATAEHKYSIIWLHGLGADGNDFVDIVPMLKIDTTKIKFIFPHAKIQAVTINGGMKMRSWYDILSPDISSRADRAGVIESMAYVRQLIKQEHQFGISYENIILAGFSQGGAVALQTVCNYPHKLGGVIAMSTYVPLADEISQQNVKTPIFMAHGIYDPVVAFNSGKKSFELLKKSGFDITFREYPMQHQVNADEIYDVARFIENCFEH